MKSKCLLILALWVTTSVTGFSQQPEFKAFKNLGISFKVSPFLGYGLEAATGLNNHFILRLGLNLTKGINAGYHNIILENDDETIDSFGYMPDFRAKPALEFAHGNLLLDYHPVGIFHITVGAFMGTTKVMVKGYLADSDNNKSQLLPGKTWPTVTIGDQLIEMNDGQASGYFQLGNTIKPYFGLGVGRAVAKNKRIAFKVELGVLYQGDFYEANINEKTINLANSSDEILQNIHRIIVEERYLKFWPQMNFQLSYRIF